MPDISKLAKGLTAIAKGAKEEIPFSRGVKTLSRAESDENLRKMLESSKIKERLFHATPEDIKFFKPGGLNPKMSGEAIWLSPDPAKTPAAHNIGYYDNPRQGVNIMPVHVQAKNPMILDDVDMLKWAQQVYGEGSREFPQLMPKKWREEVMKDYDSIVLADPYKRGDPHEVIMFEPEKIKSATGNRGTYNTDTADITKRKGGAIRKARGGLARMAGGGQPSKVLSGNIMAGASWNSINPTLADRLTEATGMPTYNAAVGATTSADTYKQLIDFIEAGGSFEEGANVFLQAGGADFLKGVSRKDTEENLDKILTELEKRGVNVVLTGSPDASSYEQVISNNFNPASDQIYNNVVAKHSNVVLVDSMGEILQDKSLLSDSIHPNEQGWEVYNDSVLGALSQLKKREEQEVQKEEPVDIPQEIEKITQTSTPEERYTKNTEAEQPVDIPEEIERITNNSQEQYTPDFQSEYALENIPQINTEMPVQTPQTGYQAPQTYMPIQEVQEAESVPYEPQEIASNPEQQPRAVETRSGPDYSRAYGALGGEEVVNNLYKQFLGMGLDEDTIGSVFSKYYSPDAQEAKKGGAIRMQVGGLGTVAKLAAAEKVAPAAKVARGFTPRLLESTTSKMLDDILANNPKLTPEAAFKKAKEQAERKLTWERETKPDLVKQYGPLARASYEKTKVNKMQNTDEAVQKRIQKANEFLDQPTEPWTPPKPELQAFDRSSIKDAIEGFPSIEQTAFPRDIPTRASTSHVEGLYTDPVNRELIKKQITRGLPLGGETFYGSLYPIKQAVLEAGMPAEKFDKWVHSLAPASARNSIINETAVGQFLRDMNARGIPLTEENVAIEMAKYKQKFGVALPLMPVHREGVASVLEGGQDLREMSKANIPTNYKIPTYGAQKTGDFGKSVVLDVHEAAGQTQGSRYHPYFKEQGGFGNTEYNAGEQGMMGIAEELGIPGGMAQAGRWFGGGELTGLKSPRGDALDILERQVAYTLKQQGKQPNPTMIRNEILNQIKTGEGQLLPWYKSEGIPDVRQTGLQRKDGGSVEAPPFHDFDQIMKRKDGGTVNTTFEQRLKSAIEKHMAGGGEVHMEEGGSYPPKKDVPEMSPQKYLELLALQPKLGLQSEKQIKAFLEEQYKKEKEEGFGTPQARMDRAIKTVTPFIGAGADIGNFAANIPHYLTEGVSAVGNYAMSKVPSMSKPASVLDTEGKGDRVAKYPLESLPEVEPFYGSAAMQRDAKNAGLMGDSESPVYDTAMAFLAPYGAAKAPKAIKGGLNATRSGLENTAAAVRNPFQSATLTMEQVAPDLGQLGGDKFKELLTRRLTMNEGAPVSMSIMGGRKTDKTLGQGLYENKAGDFETNPMVGVNIPRAGNLSTNKKLLADIGTAGQELGQEMVAAHKFTPLLFGNAKDATAMMVRGADGAPLTQKQIIELAGELPNMIASHSPKAGGMFVAPFKGDALDYAKVQEAASKILGKNAQIKFGKADPDKDIMYRGDYKDMGARAPSAESIAMRDRLKKAEARIVRPPSKSQPVSNTQPPSLTSTLR